MELLDAHNHLDFEAFDLDRAEVVMRARHAGVRSWVLAGTEPSRWDVTQQIAEETGGIAVLGIHPWFVEQVDDPDAALQDLRTRHPVGIGELGLDGIVAQTPSARARQRSVFRAQLALARELDVPVVLHCVRAASALLTVIEDDGLPTAGGLLHGWTGPPEAAVRAVRAGLHVSFGPMICRQGARRARQSAQAVPADRLLLETDAPDQAPPGQGRGEPAHVIRVLAALADLRDEDPEALARQTTHNLRHLLPV